MAISSDATGPALHVAITGEGVRVGPEPGEISVTGQGLGSGVTLDVAPASAPQGAPTRGLRVKIRADAVPAALSAPTCVTGPACGGTGKIGAAVTVNPGAWSGEPAPELAFAWFRNDAPIEGATGASYTPTPADDRAELTCRVTARNAAGLAFADSAALRVTYEAPVATDRLADEIFDADNGVQLVPTALGFIGENLTFGVTGAGATIDPATGVLSIATETPRTSETVTVTANNSGGSALNGFLVTVEAESTAESSLDDDVLFIGHSLVSPDLPQMLRQVVASEGGRGSIDLQIINGAPLRAQWEDSAAPGIEGVDSRALLAAGGTEVLVITEGVPLSGKIQWEDSFGYSKRFYDLAVESYPGARVYMYETWHDLRSGTADQDHPDLDGDTGRHIGWRERLDASLPEWEGIVGSVNGNRAADSPPLRIVPAGQAMARIYDEIARGGVPGISDIRDLFKDHIHPNHLGFYFVTMVHYAAIYRQSPVGLPRQLSNQWTNAYDAPSLALATRMQEIAWEVVTSFSSAGNPPAARPVRLATGLQGINDWTSEQPFLDVIKTGRSWSGGGWDHDRLRAGGHLDANGWLVSLPAGLAKLEMFILTDLPEDFASVAGRYRLTYEGAGTLHVDGRVSRLAYRPGDVRFDFTPGNGLVAIAIRATVPGNHIRNIRVVKEDKAALLDRGGIFNPDWTSILDRVRCVRFMDWTKTNWSEQVDWADRPKPEDYTWTRVGAPVEVMVALANQLGVDPWFCMPHMATDDYLRNFARYVRDALDPRLKAYVEYSNEVWNWQFGQTEWALGQARARWGSHGGDWMQWVGMRASQTAQIWDGAYGAEAATRLVKVIATQTDWLGLEASLLNAPLWVAEGNPAPHGIFDAYAITGYFSGALGHDSKAPIVKTWIADSLAAAEADATALGLVGAARIAHVAAHKFDRATARAAADILDGSTSGINDNTVDNFINNFLPYHRRVSEAHGLDLIMYEGGTHVVGVGKWVDDAELTEFFIHLNYSGEMAGLYRLMLEGWTAAGGALFNQFVDVGWPSKWGSWGALRHLDDSNPRWDTLLEWAGGGVASEAAVQ